MGDKKIEPFDFYIDTDPTVPSTTVTPECTYFYVEPDGTIPLGLVQEAVEHVLGWERLSLHGETVLKALLTNDRATVEAAIAGDQGIVRFLMDED